MTKHPSLIDNAVARNGRRSYRDGVLILLNGTSSAGKTTLAKALQDTLPTPYLLVGIDTVVFALPGRYVNEAACWGEVYQYHFDGDRIAGISIQPYGDQLVRGLHRAIAGLARGGLDVIVDHVLSEPAWLADLDQIWTGLDLLRVGDTSLANPAECAATVAAAVANR